MRLTSKLQYKRSEKGEFHDIAERSLDETLTLIHNYPWDTERSLASIELTCPSVTVEHPSGTYLKIGPYFSGKYSLYHLNSKNGIYLKTVDMLEQACEWVKTYFEQKGQLQGFEKYSFTLNPSSHFETNPYVYQVKTIASLRLLWVFFMMAGVVVLESFLNYLNQPEGFQLSTFLYLLFFFTLLCSPLFYLYFNYLDADRNNYLQISKGHEEFTFGTISTEKTYHKKDIASIISYGAKNSRGLWGDCEIFIITFKNGEQIKFSSLLIKGGTLWNKFPDHKIYHEKKFFPTYQSI